MSEYQSFNVRDLGAAGDGVTDDAPAIQRAFDAAPPETTRRQVYIPAGVYKLGRTLRLGSHTRLELHPQATLILADGVGTHDKVYLLTNANPETGDTNIEIRGGIFNGNNRNNPRPRKLIEKGAYGGVMLHFDNVRNLTFGHAMLCDAQSYYLRLGRVTNFLVEHLRYHTQHPTPNNDGVHLGGYCENGIIRHLRGLGRNAPNDDMVALNADDAIERIECQGMLCGPIRNVVIHDLEADQCHTFVRLLSVRSPIEHINISKLRGGCDMSLLNMDGARGCRVPLFDEHDPVAADGVGAVWDVRLSDAVIFKAEPNNRPLLNLQERVERLDISDVQRDVARDAAPGAPTLLAKYITDHAVEVEGLDEAQLAAAVIQSDATVQSYQVHSTDPRREVALRTTLQRNQSLAVPFGGVGRVHVGALEQR